MNATGSREGFTEGAIYKSWDTTRVIFVGLLLYIFYTTLGTGYSSSSAGK